MTDYITKVRRPLASETAWTAISGDVEDLVDGGYDIPIKPSDVITKSPWADVRAFGATGNGATDDTTAIQAAIDSLTDGGDVLFPPGTYLISGITITTAGIRLLGCGRNASTITYTTASGNMISVSANNVIVEGLEIDGPGTAGSDVALNFADGYSKQRVHNCLISDVGSAAIVVDTYSFHMTYTHLTTSGDDLLRVKGTGGSLNIGPGCFFNSAVNNAIDFEGACIHAHIDSCNIENSDYGIKSGGASASCQNLLCSSVHFESNVYDVRMGSGTNCSTFNGCRFGTTTSGVCTNNVVLASSENSPVFVSCRWRGADSDYIVTVTDSTCTFIGNQHNLTDADIDGGTPNGKLIYANQIAIDSDGTFRPSKIVCTGQLGFGIADSGDLTLARGWNYARRRAVADDSAVDFFTTTHTDGGVVGIAAVSARSSSGEQSTHIYHFVSDATTVTLTELGSGIDTGGAVTLSAAIATSIVTWTATTDANWAATPNVTVAVWITAANSIVIADSA